MELEKAQAKATTMIENDDGRDDLFEAMEDMWKIDWELPDSVEDLDWIHKIKSSDPHDAIRAGTRVLSSVQPRIKVHPLAPGKDNQKNSDMMERALLWHLRNAGRRRKASIVRDFVFSALLYDEVVAQVVYLPHQIKAMKAFDGDTRRLEASRRFGPFSIVVRNPGSVHVTYSDWMAEEVLLKKVVTTYDMLAFWGKLASEVEDESQLYVTIYDYTNLDERVVWAIPQGDEGLAEPEGGIEILNEEHGLGFLPWVAKVGGTTMFDEAEDQRIPLLYSIYKAGQWDTQNIVETLMASEVISYAAAPRLRVEGPSDEVDVDYGEPGRPAYVPPGHALSEMQPPTLDPNLAAIGDRQGARMSKSTVPSVILTGEVPAGTSFAALNLISQGGVKSLIPYKELAEDALADMFIQMLWWVDHSGDELTAYDVDDEGTQYTIRGTKVEDVNPTFDPKNIYIDVELTADVPQDRVARINAASMGVERLGMSKASGQEAAGVMDTERERQKAFDEQREEAEFAIEMGEMKALSDIEMRKIAMVAEMEAAARMEARRQPQQTPTALSQREQMQDPMAQQMAAQNRYEGQPGIEGQGFNPEEGGMPPAMAQPEATREMQTRRTRTGEEF